MFGSPSPAPVAITIYSSFNCNRRLWLNAWRAAVIPNMRICTQRFRSTARFEGESVKLRNGTIVDLIKNAPFPEERSWMTLATVPVKAIAAFSMLRIRVNSDA